jgi:hypothetical protein
MTSASTERPHRNLGRRRVFRIFSAFYTICILAVASRVPMQGGIAC